MLGRRIVKRVYSMQTGADTLYLRMAYSGSDVSFETDSAGTMGLKYTWGPGSDNLLAIEDESGNHYYATDRLGSIRTLAKRDGTWLLTRRWDPYGNEISRDSSASFTWGSRLRYGWTGREYDVELGMHYHRARYYSQSLRRFIQEDPVEGSTSPYAYVHGSPLEATDPSGMMDSYEMRMPDPREEAFTTPSGPTSIIDGVPYEGNNGFISGILGGGGARASLLGTFGADVMMTQSELLPDTTWVGCRPLQGAAGLVGNHCAVRVGENGEMQAGELLNVDGRNHIVKFDGAGKQSEEYTWTVVPVPAGMSQEDFDLRVKRAYNFELTLREGQPYSWRSSVNSNQFVFTVIHNAGGSVPISAVPGYGWTPGLCGGGSGRLDLGTGCSR